MRQFKDVLQQTRLSLGILFFILVIASFLRLYKLDTIPPSLNWDEAAIAWNGYSIGKTHLDEYGTKFPLTFRSFGDYKAPGLIYLTAAVTRLLGLSVWTVRLPVALCGILSVLVMYALAREIADQLGSKPILKSMLPLSCAFFLAVSPWHIFFSRGAFEATFALLLMLVGVWLFLVAFRHPYVLPLSMASLAGSMWSYHSPKIFIPLLLAVMVLLYSNSFIQTIKKSKLSVLWLAAGLLVLVYMVFPLVKISLFEKGSERLGTSIFYGDNREPRAINAGLIRDFSSNLFKHANPGFLLLGNRLGNFRTELRDSGKMTVIEYALFIAGVIYVIKRKQRVSVLLLSWLIIGIIPAAIGKEVPHGIRSLEALPAIILGTSIGLVWVSTKISSRSIPVLISVLFLIQYAFFIRDYFFKFPVYAARDWQYGMSDVAQLAKAYESSVDKVLITSTYGQPHVLTYVYQKQDPLNVLWGGMGKYQFRDIHWEGDQFCSKCLLIGTSDEIPDNVPQDRAMLHSQIFFPNGSVAFRAVLTK